MGANRKKDEIYEGAERRDQSRVSRKISVVGWGTVGEDMDMRRGLS